MSQRREGEGVLIGTRIDFVKICPAYLCDIKMYLDEGHRTDVAWRDNRFLTAMLSAIIKAQAQKPGFYCPINPRLSRRKKATGAQSGGRLL